MSKYVKIRDIYNNEYSGEIVKTGRKYVYVQIEFTGGWSEEVPFERDIGRTSQSYEDRNAIPMFLQSEE
jgi:hypothetical protein